VDRATYRLRLVLAIQIAVFGLVSFLALSLGRSTPLQLEFPELLAHVALGAFLWTNRITWSSVLSVAGMGVVGIAVGGSDALEIVFIFFIIPLVLPFYSSTKVALTTQILVWVMVAGAGTGMAVAAPDRVPWAAFVIQVAAIGLVGTLMVIFRFSLLRLIGANHRLENVLAQYRVLYDDGAHATLVLGRSGHIREVHGAADRLLDTNRQDLLGQHYTVLPASAIGKHEIWEAYLQGDGLEERHEAWVRPTGRRRTPISIHLAAGTQAQRALGLALIVEIRAGGPSATHDGKHATAF
jgi:PAS domain-containing protein